MRIKELAVELDSLPIDSLERCNGVETILGDWTIKLREPAFLYAPGIGYRLEILNKAGFPAFIKNSPTLDGIINQIHKEIELCGVLEEIV